jgi:hypothetical protein
MSPSLRCLAALSLLTIAVLTSLSASSLISTVMTGTSEPELLASTSQVGEAPVAVIGYLPDSVSNGTIRTLSAVGSYDPDGNITAWQWELEYGDKFEYMTNKTETYQFIRTGLYKIRLTVTDDDNNTGVDFTAVYSVVDSDSDGMPDWWEVKNFDGLFPLPDEDPDEDGASNLEEYVHDTDPWVPDATESEGILEQYWREMSVVASVIAVASVLVYRHQRRRRKEAEHKKVEYAIEIQKALDED